MYLEVEHSPNWEGSVFLRFKEIGPARRVSQVKTYERTPNGEWCSIVGWCDDPTQSICPALAIKVEDSGAGFSYLVYGGIWGLRLKPASLDEEWSLESANQWGEVYLSLSHERDIRYEGT